MISLPESKLIDFLKKHGKSLIGQKVLIKDGMIYEIVDITPTGFKARVVPGDVLTSHNAKNN
jgi:hypothetical protein